MGKNGLPADYPTRVVREDPNREGVLYAGTEFGMFVSLDDGKNWKSFQQNLPVTPITDIKIFRNDLIASTMGRSFWILDNISSMQQDILKVLSSKEKPRLFKPVDTHRYRHRGSYSSAVPSYPSASLIIDYYLPEASKDAVELDILDAGGNVIRTFTSKRDTSKKDMEPVWDMATNFVYPAYNSNLQSKAGLNRFKWDMRHQGAWDKNKNRSYANGPMVAPGTYTARLRVKDQVQEQSFRLLLDPKVVANGVNEKIVKEQVALSLKVIDLLSAAKMASVEIKSERKKLGERIKKGAASAMEKARDQKLATWESALETAEGRYQKPTLIAQLSYLSSMINRADQVPGKDAYDRFDELKGQWEALAKEMKVGAGADKTRR